MTRKLPLVVVLGATACGKSKLAIDLAKRFGGEIISADSMQVYNGLDIVTNKVTEDEQAQARHHMIDFLNPLSKFSVVDFRTRSLKIIDNLLSRGIMPIVVGGTNYYIESIIWKSFLIADNEPSLVGESGKTMIDLEDNLIGGLGKESLHTEEDLNSLELFFKKPIYNQGFRHISSEKLWKILEQVDQKSAHLYHHKDKRRIIRCLQIIQRKGDNYSNILKSINKSQDGKASLGGPLRYNPTCVLWVNCDTEALDNIVDERVDKMLDRGLLSELENFHQDYNKTRAESDELLDYNRGIFQSIGFKEFHSYLILDDKIKDSDEGNRILKECIKELKSSTKRYARYQLKWIRRRFLQLGTRELPPIFEFTSTNDQSIWDQQVKEAAIEIVDCIVNEQPLGHHLLSLKREPIKQEAQNNPGFLYCEPCDRTFVGSHHIEDHLNSKSHDRQVRRFKKNRVATAAENDN